MTKGSGDTLPFTFPLASGASKCCKLPCWDRDADMVAWSFSSYTMKSSTGT